MKGNYNNDNLVGYIRCSHCGKTYKVYGNELNDEDQTYVCKGCGEHIEVPFFTYCKECDKIIGVDLGSDAEIFTEIISTSLSGLVKPWTALKVLPRLFDDVPSAKGWGKCPFCNALYIRCPRCLSPVEVRPGTEAHAVLRCPDCGQKMRQP